MTTLADLLWPIYSHQVGDNRLPVKKARDLESIAVEAMSKRSVDRVILDSNLIACRSNYNTIHFVEHVHAGDIPISAELTQCVHAIDAEVS